MYDAVTGESPGTRGLHPSQIFLAFFVVIWAAAYKDGWDVEQQYCAVKWGTTNFEAEEPDRAQFVADPERPRRLSPITNQNETFYPEDKRARIQLVNYLGVAILTVVLVVVILGVIELEAILDGSGSFGVYASQLSPYLLAAVIKLMSAVYNPVAYAMNESENYKTQTAYNANLILKVFAFELANNFGALAITAYVKGSVWGCRSGHDNCLGDLKALLIAIFVVRYALAISTIASGGCCGRTSSAILQCGKRCCACLRGESSDVREDNRNPMRDEEAPGGLDAAQLAELEHPRFAQEADLEPHGGLFDDYAEIVLQMGLVCMFSLGWYLVPTLAALEILLQMRVDAYTLVCDSRRPTPLPAETVGKWSALMDFMGLLAVLTNAGIIVYTTKGFEAFTNNQRLLAFFGFEQALLACKAVTNLVAGGAPEDLADVMKRQRYVVNRHRNVVFEDEFDDDGDDLRRGHVDRSEAQAAGHGGAASTAGPSPVAEARLAYLSEKLKACDADVTIARSQRVGGVGICVSVFSRGRRGVAATPSARG